MTYNQVRRSSRIVERGPHPLEYTSMRAPTHIGPYANVEGSEIYLPLCRMKETLCIYLRKCDARVTTANWRSPAPQELEDDLPALPSLGGW